MWITLVLLSAVWTLILTATIHCRRSIDEQVMNIVLFSFTYNCIHFSRIYFLYTVMNETHCIEINMAEMLGTNQLHVTNQ